jgi:hypothetical protein
MRIARRSVTLRAMPSLDHPQSPAELQDRLRALEAERAAAALEGLIDDGPYAEDLLGEIAVCRAAFVGAAVTEIATLRGELDGPLTG